jgi:hypothetical protein
VGKTVTGLDEAIVALGCEDKKGEYHFFYCEPHLTYGDLKFEEDCLKAGNIIIPCHWFNSVTICTAETLKELKQEIQNA